jgi:hypothetical protein
VADALLIEMYASGLKNAGPDDVSCFVTSNHRDFSAPSGDHRQPHPDLADIFRSPTSRYLYQVDGLHAGLLDYFGEEFTQEHEEVEFLIGEDEPRTLAEIADAMEEFFERVWYVRSVVRAGKYARPRRFTLMRRPRSLESQFITRAAAQALGPSAAQRFAASSQPASAA